MKEKRIYSQSQMTIEELKADSKTLFICSHSGGKDSQAMYAHLKGRIPSNRLIVVHSDLGRVEWEGTLAHVKKYLSHDLKVIKAPDLLAMVEKRGMWPDGKVRYCTNNLKTDLILKLADELAREGGFNQIVNCLGIRAEESNKRAEKIPFEFDSKKSAPTKGRFIYTWLPIFEWTTRDVFKFIEVNGELPHYAYLKGMSRLSCRFCVLANKADLKLSASLNPELLTEYVDLEKKIGHTIKLHQAKPITLDKWLELPVKRKGKDLTLYSDVCG